MVPVLGRSRQVQRRFRIFRLLLPYPRLSFSIAVWIVLQSTTLVAVDSHGAVIVVTMHGTTYPIDWNQAMIDAKPTTFGLTVGDKSTSQHFIRRKTYARNGVGLVERRKYHKQLYFSDQFCFTGEPSRTNSPDPWVVNGKQ